jgi:hypothetical protein
MVLDAVPTAAKGEGWFSYGQDEKEKKAKVKAKKSAKAAKARGENDDSIFDAAIAEAAAADKADAADKAFKAAFMEVSVVEAAAKAHSKPKNHTSAQDNMVYGGVKFEQTPDAKVWVEKRQCVTVGGKRFDPKTHKEIVKVMSKEKFEPTPYNDKYMELEIDELRAKMKEATLAIKAMRGGATVEEMDSAKADLKELKRVVDAKTAASKPQKGACF